MYCRIKQECSPGGIPVFKSYRIHQEQIRNVALSLKKFTQNKHPDTFASHRLKKQTPIQNCNISRSATGSPDRKNLWDTSVVKRRPSYIKTGTSSETDAILSNGLAIRCLQCGENFPVTDFLYTNKTSLCIPCWEQNDDMTIKENNKRKKMELKKLCIPLSR